MYSWIAAVHGDAQRSIEISSQSFYPEKSAASVKKGFRGPPIDAGFGSADDSPLVESNLEPRRNSEPVRPSFANGASTSKLHGAPRPNRPVYSCSWLRCYVDLAYPKAGRVEGYKARCKCRINGPQPRPSKVRCPGQTGKRVLIPMLTGF